MATMKMPCASVGSESAPVSKTLAISSVSASSTQSGYGATNATKFSFTTAGWSPSANSTSADITINFGSSKTVDYIAFGMVGANESASISGGNMTVDIYADNVLVSSNTFDRTFIGYALYTYPVNKQATAIKVALASAVGASSLTVGNGYKILAFGS